MPSASEIMIVGDYYSACSYSIISPTHGTCLTSGWIKRTSHSFTLALGVWLALATGILAEVMKNEVRNV